MIEIKHRCGHIQETNIDKYGEHASKLGKSKEEFIKEQTEWLERHPCPYCYCENRGIKHSHSIKDGRLVSS